MNIATPFSALFAMFGQSRSIATGVGVSLGGRWRRFFGLLAAIFPAWLIDCAAEPLHGLNFSPFADGRNPSRGAVVSEAELRQHLTLLTPRTRWIRTFGVGNGLQPVGRIAHSLGLKSAIGIWLAGDSAANEREIEAALAVARAGEADIVLVGSETLLRRNLTVDQLIAYIARVKAAVPAGVQVATGETVDFWLDNPALVAACDQVWINIYPYWRGIAIDRAMASFHHAYLQVKAVAGSKVITVSETGWPSAGNTLGRSVPNAANAAAYFKNFVSWAKANAVPYFYFSYIDEPWKREAESEQGAHWGLFDAQQQLKSGMQEVFDGAVVPDNWSAAAAGGIELYHVPAYGNTTDLLTGLAYGVPREAYRFAVYILVNGRWWTKPTFEAPLTVIGADGVWACDVTTGGIDHLATQFNVYLVPANYVPPAVGNAAALPAELSRFRRLEIVRKAPAANASAPLPSQLRDQVVGAGGAASFFVTAGGTPPLTYQWRKNGTAIANATNSTLALANVAAADAGLYTVEVANAFGSVTGIGATLVVGSTPIAIHGQPAAQQANEGRPAFFEVQAAGGAPLRYQWRKSGQPIAGATQAAMWLSTVTPAMAGNYDVVVSNNQASVTSDSATLTVIASPENNAFANRSTLAGQAVSIAGRNTAATKEPNEPNHAGQAGGASVWWTWTAPIVGPVTVDTAGSSFDTTVAIYRGDALGSLAPVASNDNAGSLRTSEVKFPARAGEVFHIAVDGVGGIMGTIQLSLRQSPQDVPLILTQPQTVEAILGGNVTLEVVAAGTAPLRYAWSKNGAAIAGEANPTLELSPLRSTDTGSYTVSVSNGLGTVTSSAATVTVRPRNNAFADRLSLSGDRVSATGTNVGANKETGEPNHGGTRGGASVWWTWTAPFTGPVTIDTTGSSFPPVVAVYRGDTITSLAAVASNNSIGSFPGRFVFNANAGTVLHIAVDHAGLVTVTGDIALSIVQLQQFAPTVTPVAHQTLNEGDTLVLRAGAEGVPAPTVRWQLLRQGSTTWADFTSSGVYSGGMTANLTIARVTTANSGDQLRFIVSNSLGTVTSDPISITVLPSAWLSNLSFRCSLNAGVPVSVGVVRGGAPNPILFRLSGPGLARFMPAGSTVAANPRFEVRNAARVVLFANDDWSATSSATTAELAARFQTVGAFPWATGSSDAAGLLTGTGAYTLTGDTTTSGVGLVEVYDCATDRTSRLINISARYIAGGANAALIAGFVIAGSGTKTLLIRAVGPSLATLGLPAASLLADPRLEIHDATRLIAENDNWPAALAPRFAQVGAFNLVNGSRDAAILVELNAGLYSAVVTGGAGDALIEIYEVL